MSGLCPDAVLHTRCAKTWYCLVSPLIVERAAKMSSFLTSLETYFILAFIVTFNSQMICKIFFKIFINNLLHIFLLQSSFYSSRRVVFSRVRYSEIRQFLIILFFQTTFTGRLQTLYPSGSFPPFLICTFPRSLAHGRKFLYHSTSFILLRA